MMKLLKRISILIVFISFGKIGFSQNVVSGYVKNKTSGEPVPAVSITVKGNHTGTLTNEKGYFKISTTSTNPVILVVSSIGYETQEVNASAGNTKIEVNLVPSF